MKLSEIQLPQVKARLRVDYDTDDAEITEIMESARDYISRFTGLSFEELDTVPAVNHAFYCLCSDMYDNRGTEITNGKPNPTVDQILKGIEVIYV